MKLDKKIQTKYTTRIFCKKYRYKIVLKTKGCGWFRSNNLDMVTTNLALQDDNKKPPWIAALSKQERLYVSKLHKILKSSDDYEIRVENPLLSLYTNTKSLVETLANLDVDSVKYVSYPKPGSEELLENSYVITKRLDFDYKITMGRTRQNFTSFVDWCNGKEKVRLTKRAIKDLSKDHSWGGYYFYVKDDKTLTVVKIFLGSHIQSVEKVTKT